VPTVEFIEQFLVAGGAQYNPGERAAVSEAVAQRAIQLGCARLIDDCLVEDAKRLAEPPAHKQMRRAPALK
jgi:hypothetical protein